MVVNVYSMVCMSVGVGSVCGCILRQMHFALNMRATLQPPSVNLCLLSSLTQTLSSLFLSSTKHQFTVLPIKAYIHAANYQWHDSFDLVLVPFILFHPLSLEWPPKTRLPFNVTYGVFRFLPIAHFFRSLSHFTCRPGQIPTSEASSFDISP